MKLLEKIKKKVFHIAPSIPSDNVLNVRLYDFGKPSLRNKINMAKAGGVRKIEMLIEAKSSVKITSSTS